MKKLLEVEHIRGQFVVREFSPSDTEGEVKTIAVGGVRATLAGLREWLEDIDQDSVGTKPAAVSMPK